MTRPRQGEAAGIRSRRGKAEAVLTIITVIKVIIGNSHEARQDRGEASKRRGEAEAALLLPRGCLEARHLPRDMHHWKIMMKMMMSSGASDH